jgi:hypothetical protein
MAGRPCHREFTTASNGPCRPADACTNHCSRAFTLEPGDVIATGTPAGVGNYKEPPRFLQDGDEMVGHAVAGDDAHPIGHGLEVQAEAMHAAVRHVDEVPVGRRGRRDDRGDGASRYPPTAAASTTGVAMDEVVVVTRRGRAPSDMPVSDSIWCLKSSPPGRTARGAERWIGGVEETRGGSCPRSIDLLR